MSEVLVATPLADAPEAAHAAVHAGLPAGGGAVATEAEVAAHLTPAILEYFQNADNADVFEHVGKLELGNNSHLIVKLIVEIGHEQNDDRRELCSRLISDLFGGKVLSAEDVMRGFEVLLTEVADLKIDTPGAEDVLGRFLARAVADDCLPPVYINTHPANDSEFEDAAAREAMKTAYTLLNMTHAMSHLDTVWGVHGQRKPVKYLVREIVLCIKEYLSSGDLKEAEKCLHELGVPHFHHEVVYEAVMLVLERDGEARMLEQICQLLQQLYSAGFVTEDQMVTGLRRIHASLCDLVLDVPRAKEIFTHVTDRGRALGFVSPDLTAILIA